MYEEYIIDRIFGVEGEEFKAAMHLAQQLLDCGLSEYAVQTLLKQADQVNFEVDGTGHNTLTVDCCGKVGVELMFVLMPTVAKYASTGLIVSPRYEEEITFVLSWR